MQSMASKDNFIFSEFDRGLLHLRQPLVGIMTGYHVTVHSQCQLVKNSEKLNKRSKYRNKESFGRESWS